MLFRGIMILLLAILSGAWLNMGLSSTSMPNDQDKPEVIEEPADMVDTATVIAHSIDAFIARDIDAVMSDYAEGAILITPAGTFAGLESIRAHIIEAFGNGNQSEAPFVVTENKSTGNLGYVLWEWTMQDGSVLSGTETIIVKYGKISQHTVAYFADELPEAEETADEPEPES